MVGAGLQNYSHDPLQNLCPLSKLLSDTSCLFDRFRLSCSINSKLYESERTQTPAGGAFTSW